MDSEGSTNAELDALAAELRIPNYVRCRMKDELRGKTATACECGIVNLQNSDQAGSHWVMYSTDDTQTIAYSSFGDPVPQELVEYLGEKEEGGGAQRGARETRLSRRSALLPSPPIYTSDIQIQDFSEKSCGYYCIAILYLLSQKIPFEDIILGFKGI